MADLLQNGMSWLAGQMKDHASQIVTYSRGMSQNSAIMATLGQSEFTRESQEGLITEERTHDFLISTADLLLDGASILPEPGDQIYVVGVGTFEVASPGASAPAWRFSDPHHMVLRIHTREI